MTVDKILSILKKVDGIKALEVKAPIKIEYGNADFHTTVMDIDAVVTENKKLIVKLFSQKTLCKANDVCGITQEEELKEESCCNEVSCC